MKDVHDLPFGQNFLCYAAFRQEDRHGIRHIAFVHHVSDQAHRNFKSQPVLSLIQVDATLHVFESKLVIKL